MRDLRNAVRDGVGRLLSQPCPRCGILHTTGKGQRSCYNAWYRTTPQSKETQRRWEKTADAKEYRFLRDLKNNHGLSCDQHAAMLDAQGERCKICKYIGPLLVDHNHRSEKIRGLLCRVCNKNLGWLEKRRDIVLRYAFSI